MEVLKAEPYLGNGHPSEDDVTRTGATLRVMGEGKPTRSK